jgi:hypothetical protein
MENEARLFLRKLFGSKPEELYVLLWTLPDKRSRWFRDVDAAAAAVEPLSRHDVYVGVGLASRDYGPSHRCPSEEIAGLVGFWADLDLRSDAHKKNALPATIQDALTIIPDLIPPTIVVSTGNGAHAWWLFKEPYIFDDEERKQAASLVARWHTLLRLNAASRGWAFDRLSDLARVLRVPGTTNFKDPNNPKPVTVHSTSDRRYNLSDFEEWLDEAAIPDPDAQEQAAREWAERFKDKPLVIKLEARIPQDLLKGWMEADLRFRNTWLRQRHDLKDQSQSGYDLALACFGVDAGLTEQQIVDLIIHHRCLHQQKHRTRLDYYQRTITKASKRNAGSDPFKVPPPETPASAQPAPTPPESELPVCAPSEEPVDPARAKALLCEHISKLLGVRIIRLVKVTGKEPIYQMELEQGKIEFPNVGKLISQDSVRVAFAATVGKLIPKMKPKAWEQLAQLMLDACVVEEGSEEMEFEGAARMYVAQYLAETSFIDSIEGQTVQNARKPMVLDGRIAICASDLQIYVNKTTFQNLSVRAIVSLLKALGGKSIRVRGHKFREQSRWVLPIEEFDPADYSVQHKDENHGVA